MIVHNMATALPPTWNNIQLLRAVAVLLVALMHLEPYLGKLAGRGERYLLSFGYSGVDLFFLISGFINYCVSAPYLGKKNYSLRFLAKRAIRIFPNYWLVVSVTYYLVLYHGMETAHEFTRPIESYFLIYPLRLQEHILIAAWTLNYELLFYMVLAVLILLPRRFFWPVTIVYAVAVAIAQYWLEHWNAARLYEFAFAPYYLQFIAGMAIAHVAQRSRLPCARATLLFGLMMAVLTVWMQHAVYPEGFANPFHRDLRVWMWLSVYGPILYGLVALEQQQRFTCHSRILLLLGNASYSLYLWLMPFLYVAYRWFQWLTDSTILPVFQVYMIAGPAIFLSYLLWGCLWYAYVETPMLVRLNRFVRKNG